MVYQSAGMDAGRNGGEMKGTIFGKRKWIGLWLIIISLAVYSITAHMLKIDNEIAGKVLWGMVSVYGIYVTGNAVSKFTKDKINE